jgi:hypothetical protein
MGILSPYAPAGGSSMCRGVRRAGGAGRGRREEESEPARASCGTRLRDQLNARPGLFTAAPNGSRLSSRRKPGRCSRGLGRSSVVGHFAIVAKGSPRSRRHFPRRHAPACREGQNRPALRVPRSLTEVPAALFHARHPSPPPGNAAVSGARSWALSRAEAPAAEPPPGGGDERRSTPPNSCHHSAAATERPATAWFCLLWPGRRAPTREAGPTPGRI